MYEPQTFTVDNALPIELLSFQAQATENGDVRLTWTTASEYENDYFIVMHSLKGREFEEIGRIDAAGTSRILLKYSYTHRRPVAGLNYYRLAQVDFDGTQKLSDVVVANVALGEEPSIYPNPATDTWQVDLGGLHGFGTTIEVLDLRGAPFLKLETNDERDVTLARKGIANGVYIVRITSPGATHMMKINFK